MPFVRRPVVTALALAVSTAGTTAYGLTTPIVKGSITVKLQSFATINTSPGGTPQDLTFAPDNSGRLFLAQRNGQIAVLNSQTGALTSQFLNMSSAGVSVYTGGEGGLLGLTFAPDYTTSRKFYTFTTEPYSAVADYTPPEMAPGVGPTANNQIVIREWTANTANPNQANTTSRVLIRINHPQSNHQGGALRFGPDGNLYFSIGDGGGGNDFNGSATSNVDGHNNSIGNAQDLTSPMGKILRINPNPAAGAGFTISANGQYSIPNDNPFAAGANGARKEIFAYGLRNPFRITFDTATGTLYAADVGQVNREELDVITSGGNYGWVFREGTRNNTTDSGRAQPAGFTSIAPFAEYTHSDGFAVIGGEVYRGTAVPELMGKYVFGDLLGTASIGRLFYTDPANGNIFEFKYDPTGLTPPGQLYEVTQGASGELYALFATGAIYRITPIPEPGSLALLAAGGTCLLRRRRRGSPPAIL